jgi:hypothetical protein
VRRATPGQLDALSTVLARAFADDPMIRWPFPDLPDPEAALQICFRAWNAGNIELGLVFEAAGGAGFAVWVPRAADLVHALRPGPVRPAGCAG